MATLADDRKAGVGWRAAFLEMLSGLRKSVARFPLVTVFLLASAIQAHLLIADISLFQVRAYGWHDDDAEVVLGLMSGAGAALAATLFGEARGLSRLERAVLALFLGLAAAAFVALPRFFLVLQWSLVLALMGLIAVAPFLGRGDSGAFWMFWTRAAFTARLSLLTLLLLAGGVSAILASVALLFGIEIPGEVHGHVWVFTGLLVAPLFALGQFPDRFDEEPDEVATDFMDHAMRGMGDFVAAPLLILYAAILHLYALKIVVTREVPQGQIGWLVLVYGLCLFGTLLFVNPFFDRARAPTRALLRLWPFFLPVPLVLLFYALALRIEAFGMTPDRFLLGLFGAVAAIIVALQLSARLRGDIRLIAGLPVVALALASFGPQGALDVSVRSQANRFLEIVRKPPVDDKHHDEALSALAFLDKHRALSRVAPEGTDISPNSNDAYAATAKAWGLDPTRQGADPIDHGRGLRMVGNPAPTVFEVEGFDLVVQNVILDHAMERPVSARLPSGREISIAMEHEALVIRAGSERVRFPIAVRDVEGLVPLQSSARSPQIPLEAGDRRIMMLPTYISTAGNPLRLLQLWGTLLLRAEDW
jgi:hypothetical protein